MANILAVGTAADSSSDFDVVAGTPNTVCLIDAAGPTITAGAFVAIQYKAASGEYFTVDNLQDDRVALAIIGPGTYRVTRLDTGVACGVELS